MADVENQPDSSFPVKRKPDLCCQEQDNVANKAQKLEKAAGSLPEKDENVVVPGDLAAEEKQEEEEEEEEEDSIEAETDRKGKGISREDKGKGKLIEFDESDDDSDDDDDDDDEDNEDGYEYEDEESDLSDDPLAEVDLDNILPSRTRRRSFQPCGVYISGANNNDDVDDSSTDDSDA